MLIKPSSLAGAGLGVWIKQCLNKGLVLGPYQGVRVDWEMAAHKSGYCWEVSEALTRHTSMFTQLIIYKVVFVVICDPPHTLLWIGCIPLNPRCA